jgi:hypothetical protein
VHPCRSITGSPSDGLAIYPDDTYRDYIIKHPRLVNPSGVKITKIDYSNQVLTKVIRKRRFN